MLRCPEARAGGLARLSEDVYARSTRRSQEARIATLVKLAAAAAIALVPATVESISLLAGALKAGSYRSGAGYLGALARVHKRAGHCWTPDLEIARTDAVRSLERGMGPAKRARVVDLEAVVGHRGDTGGTQQGDIDFVTIGALWMLRGAEAAALLRDQVTVSEDTSHASIVLGAFKTNPTGRECTRTLRCSCGRTSASGEVEGVDLGRSTCPVHALVRVIERRGGLGATDKHPLFCGRNLAALTPGSARLAICRACRCVGMSEHSMRRMGAQYYARRGVPLATIQHIGRWGSATVLLYVEQALEGRASWAPVVAAVGFGDEGVAIAGGVVERRTRRSASCVVSRHVGHLPPSKRRWALAPPRSLAPTVPGARGAASVVVPGSAEPACPGGGRSGLEVIVLDSGPPPGWGPGPVGARWGGLGPVGPCPQCAGPAGAGSVELVLVGIRSGATGVGHLVRPGCCGGHPCTWVTLCGWRFGTAPHERCCACRTTCKRCLLAASSQLGVAGGGAVDPLCGARSASRGLGAS